MSRLFAIVSRGMDVWWVQLAGWLISRSMWRSSLHTMFTYLCVPYTREPRIYQMKNARNSMKVLWIFHSARFLLFLGVSEWVYLFSAFFRITQSGKWHGINQQPNGFSTEIDKCNSMFMFYSFSILPLRYLFLYHRLLVVYGTPFIRI